MWHFHLAARSLFQVVKSWTASKHERGNTNTGYGVSLHMDARARKYLLKQKVDETKPHFTWSNGDESGECKREISQVHLHTVVMPVPSEGLQPPRQFINWSKPRVIGPSADSPQEEGRLNARGVGASAGIFQARKITMKNFDVTPRSRSQLQDQQREQHQHRPGERSLLNSASALLRITLILKRINPHKKRRHFNYF